MREEGINSVKQIIQTFIHHSVKSYNLFILYFTQNTVGTIDENEDVYLCVCAYSINIIHTT